MNICLFKSKIHRARITDANLDYEGSITIDATLLKAANIREYEKVQIVDINNGARFETYAIKGEANSGTICLNGAASRLVQPNDLIIIIAYGYFAEHELATFKPTIVHVSDNNRQLAPRSGSLLS